MRRLAVLTAVAGAAVVVTVLATAMWDVHTTRLDASLIALQVGFTVIAVGPFAIAISRIDDAGVQIGTVVLIALVTVALYGTFALSDSSTAGLVFGVAALADYGISGAGVVFDKTLGRRS